MVNKDQSILHQLVHDLHYTKVVRSLRHLLAILCHLACNQPISMDKSQLSEWSSTIQFFFQNGSSSVLSPDSPEVGEGRGGRFGASSAAKYGYVWILTLY